MAQTVNQNPKPVNPHDDEFQERAAILEFDGHFNRLEAEQRARLLHPEPPTTALKFPSQAIVGSIGDLARTLGHGTEVPEEFHYAAALTLFGNLCATGLRLKVGLKIEPRLYTVLVADSDVKKSTALHKNIEIFNSITGEIYGTRATGDNGEADVNVLPIPSNIYGVASAEGLMRQLPEGKQLALTYDEMRTLVDKASVQNSTLMPMLTSLFEATVWDNTTSRNTQSVRDVHLSLLGCCTSATYDAMWTPAAMSIGILNRLFIVGAERKEKVAWPEEPNDAMVDACKERIIEQVRRLPLTLEISESGCSAWDKWYSDLPRSEHARRLDTIGFRLLALIALSTDRDEVDLPTVETVTSILDYELQIRQLTDPIDCDNKIARLEEGVRRVLSLGPQTERELRKRLHADRYGIWMFDQALTNLQKAKQVTKKRNGKSEKYFIQEEA
jgi:hypothetical protein